MTKFIVFLLLFTAILFSRGGATAAQHHYLPQHEIQTIKVATEEYDVLIRPWLGKHEYGAMVIFPAVGSDADEPGLVNFLRNNLNSKGWASISITPPKQHPRPNFATSVNEINKAGEKQLTQASSKPIPRFSEEELQSQSKQRQEFISLTLNQLDPIGAPFPGKRVLISLDQSAGTLVTLLAEQKIPLPDVLVLINPYLTQEKDNQQLAQKLLQLQIPILDLQSPDAHNLAVANHNARQQLAMKKTPYHYSIQTMELNLSTPAAWKNCLELIHSFAYRIIKQG